MASILNLDRSDPGVDELVSKWKDGGDYEVTLKIHQDKSSPNAASFTVTGLVPSDAEEVVEEVEEVEEAPAKPAPKSGMMPAA